MKKILIPVFVIICIFSVINFIYSSEPVKFPIDLSSPGAIGGTTPADANFQDQIKMKDGTATHIIKAVDEDGLGGRLTIGLDETASTMVICNVEDIDTDLGLSAQSDPKLYIYNEDASAYTYLASDMLYMNGGSVRIGPDQFSSNTYSFEQISDVDSGDQWIFDSGTGDELTDTNGEQSWMYIEPKINQSDTAAYNGLKVNVLETTPGTTIGDGSTGDGNNLINLQLESVTKMRVDRTGRIVLAETTTPAALADHAFVYAKDTAGTANVYVSDAAAGETEISPHGFELFQPDPNEPYPWAYNSTSHSLGKHINVDMAGAIRAIEQLTGKTFIHYADIPKSVDLEAAYKEQWKQEWIKDNTTEIEVTKEEAFEMVEVDERVLYDVEVVDPKTGEIKIVKQGKKLGENITGYELVDGEVKPKIEIIWEMKKVEKPQLKEDVRFNTVDGKFYEKAIPTPEQAEIVAQTGFVFEAPKWIKDRLAKVVRGD